MPDHPRVPDRPLHEVVVVGAGPAGIGVAAALGHLDIAAVVLDRDDVGASFRRWPEGMRLLTPSFPGNQFGAVGPQCDHPRHLPRPGARRGAPHRARRRPLPRLGRRAGGDRGPPGHGGDRRRPHRGDDLEVRVAGGEPLRARTVVWAAGEAQYPTTDGFPGAELGVPTVLVTSWDDHPGEGTGEGGDEVVVIGGYESGIDAAVNLAARGRRVTVVDRDAPWQVVDADPSRMLSPYTHARLRDAHDTGRLELLAETEVTGIRRTSDGRWHVAVVDVADDDRTDDAVEAIAPDVTGGPTTTLRADGPPLLATGFDGSLTLAAALDLHLLRGRTFLARPTWSGTWTEARSTLSHVTLRALPIFVGITIVAALLAWVGAVDAAARGLGPLLSALRLPAEAAMPVALASVRKDGLLLLAEPGTVAALDTAQLLAALVLAGALVPCLVTAAMIARERGRRVAVRLLARQAIGAILLAAAVSWIGWSVLLVAAR